MTLATKMISTDNLVLGKVNIFLNVDVCFPFSMIIRGHYKQYCHVKAVLCDLMAGDWDAHFF